MKISIIVGGIVLYFCWPDMSFRARVIFVSLGLFIVFLTILDGWLIFRGMTKGEEQEEASLRNLGISRRRREIEEQYGVNRYNSDQE